MLDIILDIVTIALSIVTIAIVISIWKDKK